MARAWRGGGWLKKKQHMLAIYIIVLRNKCSTHICVKGRWV